MKLVRSTTLRNVSSRLRSTGILVLLLATLLVPMTADAATPTSASLTLSDPRPSQTSQYTLTASGFSTGSTIGCIEIDLGSSADASGSISGLSTASSTLVSQSITATGTWAVSNAGSASHQLRATNGTPVAAQSGAQTIVFGAVTNGNTASTGYYAKITTYTTNACSTPVDTVTVQFIYTEGQAVSLSVDGSLSFSVAAVTSGGAVNSATTNVTTTSNTIPFGTVTASTNKIAAQDLSVSTNAGNGYTVYTRYTGKPTSGSNDIDDLATHTNASPGSFSAAGTEAFGYTTEDTTLGTGTASRFSGNKWAPFTTTNAEIIYSAAAVSAQTTRVGFQTGISSTTVPGSYTTTVVYTATPVY